MPWRDIRPTVRNRRRLLTLAGIIIVERRYRKAVGHGLSIGIFLLGYFGLRFIAEFFKERQVEQLRDAGGAIAKLEGVIGVHLNTGQWLSILPALIGTILIRRAWRVRPTSIVASTPDPR